MNRLSQRMILLALHWPGDGPNLLEERSPMAAPQWFEPDRVAYYEAAGWRAYYDHRWLKIVSLIAGLCREQFRIPFPHSLLAAAFIVRASITWVPADHDTQRVRPNLERFYRLARRYSPLDFDPARVAELEVRYWDDHRRMAGLPDVEKHGYVDTVTELHGALFGLPDQMARTSAELR